MGQLLQLLTTDSLVVDLMEDKVTERDESDVLKWIDDLMKGEGRSHNDHLITFQVHLPQSFGCGVRLPHCTQPQLESYEYLVS